MSSISVSVEWEQSTAFAGEEVKCKITFRNAAGSLRSRSSSPSGLSNISGSGRHRWKLGLHRQQAPPGSSSLSRVPEIQSQRPRVPSHRSTISLNAPVGIGGDQITSSAETGASGLTPKHRHNRSVSIISIGSQISANEEQGYPSPKQVRNVRRPHGRSASFQGLPLRNEGHSGGGSGLPQHSSPVVTLASRSSTAPFSLQRSITSQQTRVETNESSPTTKPDANGVSRAQKLLGRHRRTGSDFIGLGLNTRNLDIGAKGIESSPQPIDTHKIPESPSKELPMNRSIQRVLSPASMEGTPRSSMDVYSHSNNSSETLASEYVSATGLSQPQNTHRTPQLIPDDTSTKTDTLMMGYAQLLGSFTLDGSLVNMAPFEEVKRKGVIGGQGSGGVVGVEHSKRDSGLFGSLGWSNIGQSIGGLLGSQEPSSIREMKGIASSKSIPILSTPQAILFVDLKLKPGESRSFLYRQKLPEGIPPSHKGRAIKFAYQLLIGVQRARSADRQHIVRQVEVPFRVLPGVDSAGEALRHDLMNPHIILKNIASTEMLGNEQSKSKVSQKYKEHKASPATNDTSFTMYVKSLMQKSRQDSNLSPMSPTETSTPIGFDGRAEGDSSTRERIEAAIFQGINSTQPGRNVNRFQIHRDGIKVASIILGRSAYRLGETISTVVDFTGSETFCYTINVSLETFEIIDPAIALRSPASIHRATRRVHAQCTENTIAASKIVFNTIVPLNATPEFITTGVRLEWRLKFEFITESVGEQNSDGVNVLETILEDDRGKIRAAAQELYCQSFDASVPIKIYGSIKDFDDTKPPLFFI